MVFQPLASDDVIDFIATIVPERRHATPATTIIGTMKRCITFGRPSGKDALCLRALEPQSAAIPATKWELSRNGCSFISGS